MIFFRKDRIFTIVSLAIGFISFCFFCDINIVIPTNYKWLMFGDPSQHYLGWATFRSTPILQWPIGLNYNYGMETSSSIVFTDSIPLLAIAFKYANNILPVNFQYTGMWLMSCFMLQSYFGYRVLNKLTENNSFSLICGFILSFAPMFIVRTQNHYALCAQFLILASFLLYLSRSNNKKWILLICISSLVHAYLLLMILIVYTTRVIVDVIEVRNFKSNVLRYVLSILMCAIIMYASGYFVIDNGVSADGYGIYRADLMTFFNPVDQYMSRFMRVNNNQLTNGEGLGYIGYGIIVSFASLFIATANNTSFYSNLKKPSFVIPIIAIILVYLFAVSNVISLQGFELLRINLPDKIERVLNIFRCGGRFIWIVSYVLMIAVLSSVFFLSKNNSFIIISIIALIQLSDISRFRIRFEAGIDRAIISGNKIESQNYNIDYNKFRSIVMLSPRDFIDKSAIIYLAAMNHLPVNSGYMARYDVSKEQKQNESIKVIISKKRLDDDTIYFIGKSASSLLSLCHQGYYCETGLSGTIIYKK